MDWLTFENVTTGLIALFTGLTGLISWKLYRDQKAQQLPAVFLRCDLFDNGCSLRITVRNRADHPMRVTEIEVINSRQIGLVTYRGSASGTRGDQRINEIYGKGIAESNYQIDMTLTSANRDDDSGYREFVLFAVNPPARIKIKVTYDPSDGRGVKQIVRRTYTFSDKERQLISTFKLPGT